MQYLGGAMPDTLNQLICFNFYKGWREITSLYKDVYGNDITPQNVYLLELCDLDNGITIKQLSKGMGLDSSAVSTLVARMEKKGLIKRVHGVEDRRTVFVQLSQEGASLKQKINEKADVLTKALNSNITLEESTALQGIVMKLKLNREPLERSQVREFNA